MKTIALIAAGLEQGRLVEISKTGVDSVELKSRFWSMYHAGGSPEVALAYITIGSSFVVGLSVKPTRKEGAGSERVARPSFWGWVANDKTQLNDCILRLLFFPSFASNEAGTNQSWIDQIIEQTELDQSMIQERVSGVLDIVSRFGSELSGFVEVIPKDISLGNGLPGKNGLSTTYVAADRPCLQDLLSIALKESSSWNEDDGALIGGFGDYRVGGVTSYRVDRYPLGKTFLRREAAEPEDKNENRRSWSALKWWN